MSEPDKDQWFVVHVLSGQEQKVYENLTRRIKKEEMGDLVYEVLIPTERVSEIKRGKRTETTRKLQEYWVLLEPRIVQYPCGHRKWKACWHRFASGKTRLNQR